MMAAMDRRPWIDITDSIFRTNQQCPTAFCIYPGVATLVVRSECTSKSVQINNALGCTYYTIHNSTVGDSERRGYTELQEFKNTVREDLGRNISSYGMNCSFEEKRFPKFAINLEVPTNNTNSSLLQGLGNPRGRISPDNLSQDGVFGNTYQKLLNGGETRKSVLGNHPLSLCASGYDGRLNRSTQDFDIISPFTCFNSSAWAVGHVENIDNFGEFSGTLTWCRLKLVSRTYGWAYYSIGHNELSLTDYPLEKVGMGSHQDVIARERDKDYKYLIGPASTAKLARMIEATLYSESLQEYLIELVAMQGWEELFERVGKVATGYIQSSQNPEAGNATGKPVNFLPFFEVR